MVVSNQMMHACVFGALGLCGMLGPCGMVGIVSAMKPPKRMEGNIVSAPASPSQTRKGAPMERQSSQSIRPVGIQKEPFTGEAEAQGHQPNTRGEAFGATGGKTQGGDKGSLKSNEKAASTDHGASDVVSVEDICRRWSFPSYRYFTEEELTPTYQMYWDMVFNWTSHNGNKGLSRFERNGWFQKHAKRRSSQEKRFVENIAKYQWGGWDNHFTPGYRNNRFNIKFIGRDTPGYEMLGNMPHFQEIAYLFPCNAGELFCRVSKTAGMDKIEFVPTIALFNLVEGRKNQMNFGVATITNTTLSFVVVQNGIATFQPEMPLPNGEKVLSKLSSDLKDLFKDIKSLMKLPDFFVLVSAVVYPDSDGVFVVSELESVKSLEHSRLEQPDSDTMLSSSTRISVIDAIFMSPDDGKKMQELKQSRIDLAGQNIEFWGNEVDRQMLKAVTGIDDKGNSHVTRI